MDNPYSEYSNVKFSSPTQTQMDKADKEARKLAVKEKIAEEMAERERVAAEKKREEDKLKYPDNYSDSDDDVGLSDQKIEHGVKIDETYWAESSVEPPPIGLRLFDDKIGPVYPSYIGKDGEVRAVKPVPAKNWLSSADGGKRSKRRRKSNRRVATRKSKRGRTTKSKRGVKSKRTRS
jgi:hypothetical protein